MSRFGRRHRRHGRVKPSRGGGLLHPGLVVAVAILLVNGLLLQVKAPGLVSGKLSDVAGLAYFPLFLQALWGAREAEPVHATMDVTDLAALPAVALSWRWGRHRTRGTESVGSVTPPQRGE
jgi:hypothetical protein